MNHMLHNGTYSDYLNSVWHKGIGQDGITDCDTCEVCEGTGRICPLFANCERHHEDGNKACAHCLNPGRDLVVCPDCKGNGTR